MISLQLRQRNFSLFNFQFSIFNFHFISKKEGRIKSPERPLIHPIDVCPKKDGDITFSTQVLPQTW